MQQKLGPSLIFRKRKSELWHTYIWTSRLPLPHVLSLFYCRCWDDTGAMRAASRSHVNPPPTCRRRRWSQGELEAAAAPSSPRAPRWQRTLCWRSFGGCREYGLCRGGTRFEPWWAEKPKLWNAPWCKCVSVPVMALRISVAAASLISSDACSLYQAVWGVQIRLGASFRGPKEKLIDSEGKKREKQID